MEKQEEIKMIREEGTFALAEEYGFENKSEKEIEEERKKKQENK